MKREELRTPAEYIIFNIYDDDHYRNLNGWRRGLTIIPAPYVKANPATGEFVECQNPCPTPESLYGLCDLDWIDETFKDDFQLRITLACENIERKKPERSYEDIQEIAEEHGLQTRINSTETLSWTVQTLYSRSALFASSRILEKMEEFAGSNGKKILYALSYSPFEIAKAILRHIGGRYSRERKKPLPAQESYRFDNEFVDFLQKKHLPYVDLMEAHVSDFTKSGTKIEDYLNQYYIGHYNPRGNFFEAFSIKNKLVEMLEPKPISYQETAEPPQINRSIDASAVH
jgi:hypothetical protein